MKHVARNAVTALSGFGTQLVVWHAVRTAQRSEDDMDKETIQNPPPKAHSILYGAVLDLVVHIDRYVSIFVLCSILAHVCDTIHHTADCLRNPAFLSAHGPRCCAEIAPSPPFERGASPATRLLQVIIISAGSGNGSDRSDLRSCKQSVQESLRYDR